MKINNDAPKSTESAKNTTKNDSSLVEMLVVSMQRDNANKDFNLVPSDVLLKMCNQHTNRNVDSKESTQKHRRNTDKKRDAVLSRQLRANARRKRRKRENATSRNEEEKKLFSHNTKIDAFV